MRKTSYLNVLMGVKILPPVNRTSQLLYRHQALPAHCPCHIALAKVCHWQKKQICCKLYFSQGGGRGLSLNCVYIRVCHLPSIYSIKAIFPEHENPMFWSHMALIQRKPDLFYICFAKTIIPLILPTKTPLAAKQSIKI